MRSRWAVLAAGTVVQAIQAAAVSGLAVLAPVLRDRYHLSLTQIGVLLGGSGIGAVLTFLPWGLAADRLGERVTATVGALGAAAGLAGAAYASGFAGLVVLLSIAGAFGASANTATARVVTSWFPRERRGFALGIRQTSIPIGGFAAALSIPPIADHWGSRAALVALAAASVVAAILAVTLMVAGPIRSDLEDPAEALRHPIRDRRVWRLSLGSSLVLCSQVAVLGFVVLFLESQRGYSHTEAGAVLAAINVVGAAGRLGGGRLSDLLGTRLGLMRWIVLGAALALGAARRPGLGVDGAPRPGSRARRRAVHELERSGGGGHHRAGGPEAKRGGARGPADPPWRVVRGDAGRVRSVRRCDLVARRVRAHGPVPAARHLGAAPPRPLSDNRAMERVLMLAGDAVEDLELFFILYRLREAGYAVDVAAPSRRALRTVVHDFEPDSDAYVEKPGRRLEPDLAFSEVEPERYVGLVIPGGRAPEYIRVDPDVRRIVSHFFDRDLPVGTLCHGPQVPAALGYLQGRKSSGFPPLGPDIEAAGGTYVDGPDVVDGNMVSARGWGDLAEWSKAFVAALERAAVPA